MRPGNTARLRKITLGLFFILLASGVFAVPALAKDPSVSTLQQRLRHARRQQHSAHARVMSGAADLAGAQALAASAASGAVTPDPSASTAAPVGMDPRLAATLLADGVVTADEVAALQSRLTAAQRLAHRWDVKVRALKQRIRELRRIARWNRTGRWKPLIAIASREYHVSAAGLTHMMMLESNGQRHADSGPYHGLFQFMGREWAMSWNEWRDHSIYDGWSQIQLAAKCISRSMGPSIWPLTYGMSF